MSDLKRCEKYAKWYKARLKNLEKKMLAAKEAGKQRKSYDYSN